MCRYLTVSLFLFFVFAPSIHGSYKPLTPRLPRPGEIPISAPGNCPQAGSTFLLTKDISSPTSAIFLGKDVILDLNGHTLTYAAGYQGVPN